MLLNINGKFPHFVPKYYMTLITAKSNDDVCKLKDVLASTEVQW